ncbi:type 1 glutamine amidotransferase [Cecembia lonarensis]|uniref:Glutamine amidotransferase n=1 Tax=Cecembia lonarensis (strain CCUG 58316 / KCTC 22772 / LW9) TaxID=1225176 RepID=K1LAN8_CECL9|nr:homoserine O-succinyltransferase [Cecembia lonarensis]EKB47473.1 glutamine amidotransferase [Cecembia lonarensis LW9]
MQGKIRVALLDMYNGKANQGMRCIHEIVGRFENQLVLDIYDVRQKHELPNFEDYNLFISSGGPGNPLEGDGIWEVKFEKLLDDIYQWNLGNKHKKYMLFICHSFQLAVQHFGLAEVNKRKSTSFGVMTIHKTEEGMDDPLFRGLDNPFWAIDSRDYQVVKPKVKKFKEMGAKIIALEKLRNHLEYERALMGIRFSDEMVGTQFHPEADPVGFMTHLKKADVREEIIALKGKTKYLMMLEHVVEEHTIYKTNETLIPNFLRRSIRKIREQEGIFV